ncbi:MAG: hypothetical protein ABI821_08535 [Pseudomonadota bacterium]
MNTHNHIPDTVAASLDARLAPFHRSVSRSPEVLDVETSRAVAPRDDRRLHLKLVNDLKLLFAALVAGGSVVPLGDNRHAAKLLSSYAASLRDH